jgi:MFS family permease
MTNNEHEPIGGPANRTTSGAVATSSGTPRKVILASLVGTSLEWYDFFLYATASAVVFNKLFFPTFDPLVGTLLAFSTAAVGFASRPLGGIIFGHFGDKIGRKQVLVVTLMLMGGATFLIGALPSYAAIGIWAPILLGILRFLQGLGLGGEWGGAVLMTLEHGSSDRRGFNASWPQIGVPVGNLLAAAVLGLLSATLSDQAFLSWGWRVGFFLSGALVLVGLWIRLTVAESPLFAEVANKGEKASMPLLEVIKRHPRGLLVSMGLRIGTDVAFYTFTSYILVYVTTNLGLARSVGLNDGGADPAGEHREHIEFFGGQRHRLASGLDGARVEVDRHVAHLYHCLRRAFPGLGPLGNCLDPGQQLVQPDRLEDEVVSTASQQTHGRAGVPVGGQRKYRQRADPAQSAEQFEPVEIWQTEIE